MVNLYHSPLLHPFEAVTQDVKALIRKNSDLSVAGLFQKSQQLAVGLSHLGFKAHDIVLVTLPPGEAFLVVIYAVAMLRGKVAIIDPEMGSMNFSAKLRQLAPRWAFVDSRLLLLQEHPLLQLLIYKIRKNVPQIPALHNCIVIATGRRLPTYRKYLWFNDVTSNRDEIRFSPFDDEHEFLIVYTSGTIQEPKGVVHSFHSLTKSISNLVKLIDKKPGDILGTELPHYMLLGVATGIPTYIFTTSVASPKQRLAEMEGMKITLLFGAPAEYLPLIEYCEKNKRLLPQTLRKVFFGSAPVHNKFLKRFFAVAHPQLEAICLYGMTELLVSAWITGKEKLQMKSCEGDMLGRIWDDVECRIHCSGEIMLKSPQLFSRYLHDEGRDGFHASGDTGYLDESGNLILTGRKKDMIIRKNFNIYPAIYETIIRHHEGVVDCAMVGIYNDSKADEEVYLVVESKSTKKGKLIRNLEFGPLAVPREAWPDKIVYMPVPRSGRHRKIDKKRLRDLLITSTHP